MIKKKALFFIITFITFLQAIGQPISLDGDEKNEIGLSTFILEDPTAQLSINEIVKSKDSFSPCEKKVFSSVNASSAFWIKFEVKNNTNENNHYLIIDNPFINELDYYSEDQNKITHLSETGNSFPFSHRFISKNNFLLPINLHKGESKTFYLRYYSTWRMELPLSILSSKKVIERSTLRDLWYGIFYGILLVSLLYNFFLFLMIRTKSYVYYLLIILSLGFFRSLSHGLSFQFLFSNHPEFNNTFIYLFFSLLGLTLILFAWEFLKTKERTPKLHNAGYFIVAALIGAFIVSFIDKKIWVSLSTIIMLAVPVYLIITGVFVYRQGYSPARFYLLGSGWYLISILVACFRTLGLLPYSFFTYNFGDVGLALDTIFFALALGDRYNEIQKEKKEAQKRLNKELELKIVESTRAHEQLSKMNDNIRIINTDLDNFIYTASHDLKVPVVNIEGLINILEEGRYDEEEQKKIFGMIKSSVEKFKVTINDLTEITKVQRMRENDVESNLVKNIIHEITSKYKNIINDAGIQLNIDINECPSITFSKKNLIKITDNLIDNAIKFYSPDRKPIIHILTKETDEFQILRVKDNGLGIPKNNHEKIFTMFKRAHDVDGRGLGLYFVKRIIEDAGGRIEVESKEGEGSEFCVYFKK